MIFSCLESSLNCLVFAERFSPVFLQLSFFYISNQSCNFILELLIFYTVFRTAVFNLDVVYLALFLNAFLISLLHWLVKFSHFDFFLRCKLVNASHWNPVNSRTKLFTSSSSGTAFSFWSKKINKFSALSPLLAFKYLITDCSFDRNFCYHSILVANCRGYGLCCDFIS